MATGPASKFTDPSKKKLDAQFVIIPILKNTS